MHIYIMSGQASTKTRTCACAGRKIQGRSHEPHGTAVVLSRPPSGVVRSASEPTLRPLSLTRASGIGTLYVDVGREDAYQSHSTVHTTLMRTRTGPEPDNEPEPAPAPEPEPRDTETETETGRSARTLILSFSLSLFLSSFSGPMYRVRVRVLCAVCRAPCIVCRTAARVPSMVWCWPRKYLVHVLGTYTV